MSSALQTQGISNGKELRRRDGRTVGFMRYVNGASAWLGSGTSRYQREGGRKRGTRGALDGQNIQTISLMRILSCSQSGDQSSSVSRLGTTTMNNQTYIECDNKPCRQFTNRQYISPCSPTASSLLRGGTGYVVDPQRCDASRTLASQRASSRHGYLDR